MWRNAIILSVVGMLLMPAFAQAQFTQGDWELTLGGTGTSDKDFDTGAFSISGSLGYFVSDQLEVAVRQGIVWADGGSAWGADTRVAADYHFDLGAWQPFVGGSIGYLYGDTNNDNWIAGPEAGVKYFVNNTTFIQAVAAYAFDLEEGFDEGSFLYSLGVGFRF